MVFRKIFEILKHFFDHKLYRPSTIFRFKTGDIAKIDQDKFIFITGRLKEIIITAGGENINPLLIEDGLRAELPTLLNNCMLVGDKKKYLVVLLTLKVYSKIAQFFDRSKYLEKTFKPEKLNLFLTRVTLILRQWHISMI
jgi:long-subunit acyl-CoA synthetase (AMP-forming)